MDPSRPTPGSSSSGEATSPGIHEHHPRLAPGGSLPYLQHVRPSLHVSLNPLPSLLATNRIKRSRSPYQSLS